MMISVYPGIHLSPQQFCAINHVEFGEVGDDFLTVIGKSVIRNLHGPHRFLSPIEGEPGSSVLIGKELGIGWMECDLEKLFGERIFGVAFEGDETSATRPRLYRHPPKGQQKLAVDVIEIEEVSERRDHANGVACDFEASRERPSIGMQLDQGGVNVIKDFAVEIGERKFDAKISKQDVVNIKEVRGGIIRRSPEERIFTCLTPVNSQDFIVLATTETVDHFE